MSGTPATAGFTVFIVDDDSIVVESLRCLVHSAGMQAEGFTSPKKFLDSFHPPQRGCLLLDLRMSEMGGLELQSELVATGARIPIIIMTGDGDSPERAQALAAGAFDFILKPCDGNFLLNRIRQAIEETYTA